MDWFFSHSCSVTLVVLILVCWSSASASLASYISTTLASIQGYFFWSRYVCMILLCLVLLSLVLHVLVFVVSGASMSTDMGN